MKCAIAALAAMFAVFASNASAQQAPAPPPTAPPPTAPPPSRPPTYYPPPGYYPPYYPRPVYILPAPYIRGDAGGAFSTGTHFHDTSHAAPTLGEGVKLQGNSGQSAIYDAGVGARFTPNFRADLTFSYLPSLRFSGSDNLALGTSNTAAIHSWVAMVNFYVDFWPFLTVIGPMQPYFDIGFGAARNSLGSMNSGLFGGSIAGHTQTDFAGAVGVGVAWAITRQIELDLAYKFIDLGDMQTGSTLTVGSTATTISPIRADLSVHTVTLGMRYNF